MEKSQLREKLIKDFPLIWNGQDPECEDGWLELLYILCSKIQSNISASKAYHKRMEKRYKENPLLSGEEVDHEPIPQVEVNQVKEKFGGLCFYYHGGNDEIMGAVSLAEDMSYHICEICGSTKDIGFTKGWITTLCKECHETRVHYKDRPWTPSGWPYNLSKISYTDDLTEGEGEDEVKT